MFVPFILMASIVGPGDKWQVRSPTNEKKVRRWSFDEVNGWYYQVDDGKKTFV